MTGQLTSEQRRAVWLYETAGKVVREVEKLDGRAAYEAWRAEQPAHVFTDSEAPA